MRKSWAIAYGICGHSYHGCICEHFEFDPELTVQKDKDAKEAAEELMVDLIRDGWVNMRGRR